MNNTLDIGPWGVDGRVEGEASLVDPEIGAAPVHYLTLKVYLHLESRADNKGLIKPISWMTLATNLMQTTSSSSNTDLLKHILSHEKWTNLKRKKGNGFRMLERENTRKKTCSSNGDQHRFSPDWRQWLHCTGAQKGRWGSAPGLSSPWPKRREDSYIRLWCHMAAGSNWLKTIYY